MKISKLFHWLYAIVMLLPIFAIGSTCLISTFNQESKNEVKTIYKYETNEVNSANDLVQGRIYHYEIELTNDTAFNNIGAYTALYNVKGSANSDIEVIKGTSTYLRLYQVNLNASFYDGNQDSILNISNLPNNKLICDVVFYNLQYLDSYTNYSICENIPIDRLETSYVDSTIIFYRSIDKVVESPLFNWAYNSFLVTPFSYIANVFSMPVNSPIVMLLSYWLAISVIWLVFDLIMYVPLLVHSWIDRGMVK